MANMAQENLDHAIHGFLNQSDEFVDKIYHREEDINNVSHAITDYLVKVQPAITAFSRSEDFGFHVLCG